MSPASFTGDSRPQYRELVAQVAAKAKSILPQTVNGRVESAIKLVLAGDVELLGDGTVRVGSSSDPERYHLLMGQTCTCQDFAHGKAPEGWCQHRIAAGIDKRVRELIAAMPAPAAEPPAAPLPEAPASANCYITLEGRQVQVTLRDTDEIRLLARLEALLKQYPAVQPVPQSTERQQGWCVVHKTHMRQTTKHGRSWFSHKLPDGRWCKGKEGAR
jgi:hypothetical protein